MSTKLIEQNWQQVVQQNFPDRFCCEAHREFFREMFFTGAMAAMNALTGWDPDAPQILTISMAGIALVRDELTIAYHAATQPQAQPGMVRH